ncbi:hypothetical protein Nepgr_002565 [Nepenthes gracilis]|uniref:Uncharacterized protein n=1 Tax=Nepenthes gracilis TaxID=150966 RepID=A0AAD3RYC4_NEPGR|nr:hypothetical protein Nepgr_002565 [Nepenthes gracilis]
MQICVCIPGVDSLLRIPGMDWQRPVWKQPGWNRIGALWAVLCVMPDMELFRKKKRSPLVSSRFGLADMDGVLVLCGMEWNDLDFPV